MDIDPELNAIMDLIMAIRDKQRREREAQEAEIATMFLYLETDMLHNRPDNFAPDNVDHDAMRWADDGGYVND